jgi:hypothetical protein
MNARKNATLSVVLLGLLCWAGAARADQYERLAAVADYPAALVRLADRVDALIEKANALSECRLDQLQRIAASVIDGEKSVEGKIFEDLLNLETKTMADLRQLMSPAK